MKALIIRTRLEVLRWNLGQVKLVLEAAKRRGQDMDSLRNLLFGRDGVKSLASRVKTKIELSRVHLESHLDELEHQGEHGTNALNEIQGAIEAIGQLTSRLTDSENKLAYILGDRVEFGKSQEMAFQERLVAKAIESITRLNQLSSRIDDKETPPSEHDWRTAWEEYGQRLSDHSEPLFAEYVDLLRGLALREAGLENKICQLADRLLEGCDRVSALHWHSLAIPADRGAGELTPAHMIRLGFPEWTIWALPLAAYEFGRILVREHKELRRCAKHDSWQYWEPKSPDNQSPEGLSQLSIEDQQILEDSLADAFATYVVGPAYACAAMLMRFNPKATGRDAGHPADWRRARVVLEMLRMADESSQIVSFDKIRKQLKEAWHEAVEQAGAALASDEDDEPEGSRLRQWTRSFWIWAEQNSITAKYPPSSWEIAGDWAGKLLEKLDEIHPPGDDVRDVLNTAWLCRLENPERTDDISKAADLLWQKMQAKASPRGAVTSGAQRSRATPGPQRTGTPL